VASGMAALMSPWPARTQAQDSGGGGNRTCRELLGRGGSRRWPAGTLRTRVVPTTA